MARSPPRGAVVDPTLGELRLAIVAANGAPLFTIATPGGVFDHRLDTPGWRVRSGGRSWSFIDPDGVTGVRSLLVNPVSERKIRVTMRVQKPIVVTEADLPLRVQLDVPQGACGLAVFAEDECRAGAEHATCR